MSRSLRVLLGVVLAATLVTAQLAFGQNRTSLPAAVLNQEPRLRQLGQGSQSYLGMRVYRVTLWATDPKWNPDDPHALDLESNRAVPKDQGRARTLRRRPPVNRRTL